MKSDEKKDEEEIVKAIIEVIKELESKDKKILSSFYDGNSFTMAYQNDNNERFSLEINKEKGEWYSFGDCFATLLEIVKYLTGDKQ